MTIHRWISDRACGDELTGSLSENSFLMDSLIAFAHDLNGQSRPGNRLQTTKVGCKIFCVHNGFRNRLQVAADLVTDGKFVAYIEIKSHLASPSSANHMTGSDLRVDIHQGR
jgi:hypothetical protein